MHLGAAHTLGKPRPIEAAAVELEPACIDQIDRFGQAAAQPAMAARDHQRQQFGKRRARPQRVGIRQGRPLRQLGAQVIEPRLLARHAVDDVAQARRPGQLAIQQRDELAFRRQPAHPSIGPVLFHQALEIRPRHLLQQIMKHAILMQHGICPLESGTFPNVQPRVESMPCPLSTKTQPDSRGPSPAIHVFSSGIAAAVRRGWPGQSRPRGLW
jgi:hypothetical protein